MSGTKQKKEPGPLGRLITQLRTGKNMFKRSLANLSGVGKGVIDDLENGWSQTTRVENLERMAAVLEVPVEHLQHPEKHLKAADANTPPMPEMDFDDEPEPKVTINIAITIDGEIARTATEILRTLQSSVDLLRDILQARREAK